MISNENKIYLIKFCTIKTFQNISLHVTLIRVCKQHIAMNNNFKHCHVYITRFSQ